MQHEPRSRRAAINGIARDRRARMCELHARLMHAPGLEHELEQCPLAARLHDRDLCDRTLALRAVMTSPAFRSVSDCGAVVLRPRSGQLRLLSGASNTSRRAG